MHNMQYKNWRVRKKYDRRSPHMFTVLSVAKVEIGVIGWADE